MFGCDICGTSCKNKGGLASHMRKHSRAQGGNVEMVNCFECGNSYKGKNGLEAHRRRAHPDIYHASKQPVARVKARWMHEELVLFARAELDLRESALPRGMVYALHERFPQRSLEAIKSMRTKNRKYQQLLLSLASEELDRGSMEEPVEQVVSSPEWEELLLGGIKLDDLCVDNLDWVNPGCPDQSVRAKLDEEFSAWIALLRNGASTRTSRTGTGSGAPKSLVLPTDSRRRRRAQYSFLQNLYGKNRSACAQKVIDGNWVNPTSRQSPPLNEMLDAWRPIFECPSVEDVRQPAAVGPVQWVLVRPVVEEEVQAVLATYSKSAAGPDGIALHEFVRVGVGNLCSHFNLWLLCGSQPREVCVGRLVFVQKDPDDHSALNHRPITIASHVIRLFHKIMARRLEACVPFTSSQKGFKRGDGIAQHVWTLSAIINDAKAKLKSLNVAFLDVRKAFDSVSHDTILLALRRVGCPPPFLSYIRELYSRSMIRVEHCGEFSSCINICQGVKQGDPMSPTIFNAVIDWALSSLDGNLGYMFGDLRVNNLAYADDVVLISESQKGLQVLLKSFEEQLSFGGLRISSGLEGKSASLCIAIDGKAKRWVVNPVPFLVADGAQIPALTASSEYKYLGIMLGSGGAKVRVALRKQLSEGLSNITKAPLKPQQRMYILRTHLLPGLLHELVLAPVTDGWLRWFDVSVRSAVRSWLKLPNDTCKAFFHAKVGDGGLGIVSLRYTIPVLKRNRLEAVFSASDPISRALLQSQFFKNFREQLCTAKSINGRLVTDKESLADAWASDLYTKLDGRGLSGARSSKESSLWVTEPPRTTSGAKFIGSIKTRGGLLHTKVRASRGRMKQNVGCDACLRPESAQHIIQVCERTRGPRIKRHDKVVKYVSVAAERAGYKVMIEPRISCPTLGIRKPDLVFWNNSRAFVVDITVTSDQVCGDVAHRQKVVYYDHPEIRQWVSEITGVTNIVVSAVAANWRGVFSPLSAKFLKEVLVLSHRKLSLLGLMVCEGSWAIHRFFHGSTFRVGY